MTSQQAFILVQVKNLVLQKSLYIFKFKFAFNFSYQIRYLIIKSLNVKKAFNIVRIVKVPTFNKIEY